MENFAQPNKYFLKSKIKQIKFVSFESGVDLLM